MAVSHATAESSAVKLSTNAMNLAGNKIETTVIISG